MNQEEKKEMKPFINLPDEIEVLEMKKVKIEVFEKISKED
jgi:hypothetical protein